MPTIYQNVSDSYLAEKSLSRWLSLLGLDRNRPSLPFNFPRPRAQEMQAATAGNAPRSQAAQRQRRRSCRSGRCQRPVRVSIT